MPNLRGRVIALDVETTGLDPYREGARIFAWGYLTDAGEYGFVRKTAAGIEWVKRLFADPTKHIVFHNGKFDLKLFTFEGVDIYNAKAQFHCTLIEAKLFNMNGNFDLRGLGLRYLVRDTAKKDAITDWLKDRNRPRLVAERGRKLGFEDAPFDMVKDRCLWDAETTLLLHHFFHPRIRKFCAELYERERKLMCGTVDVEAQGFRIDITRAKDLKKQALKGISRLQKILDSLICPLTYPRKKKGNVFQETVYTFNANSTALQMPAAFQKLGIELLYKTKPKKGKKGGKATGGGNWSFDEYSMIRYVSKPLASIIRDSGEEGWTTDRFIQAVYDAAKKHDLPRSELLPPFILKIRELSKMVSTYYNHLIDGCIDLETGPDGREYGILHCSFNQNEALTGRFSSSNPNLQNMPRLLGPRECFITRKGRRNWHFDFSQVEMKFFVHFSKDERMASAIQSDIHEYTASVIYGVPREKITTERRKRAKAINFGILYGAGPPKVAETLTQKGLPTSRLETSKLCADYHRSFPSIRILTRDLKIELIRVGYVTNPFGRRYHIKPKEAYKALNYLCQGTSADLMKKVLLDVWQYIRAKGFKSRILGTIHDEIIVEMPRNEERTLIPIVRRMMEDRKSFYVPITVDVECVPKRWSEKKSAQEVGFDLDAA